MKKILLLILCILLVVIINAQNRGYFWYFNSSPINSIAATVGSPGTYTLSTLGSGSIAPGTNDMVVVGDCNGNFQVGAYTKPFGLVFSNNPSFVGNSYTISMVFKYTDQGAPNEWKRIVNFENPTVAFPAYGIFIASGRLNFYEGLGVGTYVTGVIFPINTYFQLDMVRDGTTKLITCYKNGVQVGTYPDNADIFKPKASGNFGISFYKGFFGEESGGNVVKLGIFNYKLSTTQIQSSLANICNPAFIITLPVTLKQFIAKKSQRQVDLSWTTSEEQNNRGFEIQRSIDGLIFSRIGWVDGLGNSNTDHTYQFVDIVPVKGKNYYRLKQIDFDNKSKLSEIRMVDFDKTIDFILYPNPVKTELIVQFTDEKQKEVLITDLLGKTVWVKKNVKSFSETVPVSHLAKGIYIMKVVDRDGGQVVQKFVKE